jgi:hypothetical protein
MSENLDSCYRMYKRGQSVGGRYFWNEDYTYINSPRISIAHVRQRETSAGVGNRNLDIIPRNRPFNTEQYTHNHIITRLSQPNDQQTVQTYRHVRLQHKTIRPDAIHSRGVTLDDPALN